MIGNITKIRLRSYICASSDVFLPSIAVLTTNFPAPQTIQQKWGKYGCRRFVNFTFFSLHILTLQVIFPEKII